MKIPVVRNINVLLDESEEFSVRVFGDEGRFRKKFDLSQIPRMLRKVSWDEVLLVFIPKGFSTNDVVKRLIEFGSKKPKEETEDLSWFSGSGSTLEDELYLIHSSPSPDPDTMGLSGEDVLGLRDDFISISGYLLANTLSGYCAKSAFDTETYTIFPEAVNARSRILSCDVGHDYRVRVGSTTINMKHERSGVRFALRVPLRKILKKKKR